jgi:hypothetical protein
MSVLCTLANGWIVSHEHFVRNIYERVEGIPARRFAFDSSLFEINTPFVRSCFNKDNSVHEENCVASPLRKRRNPPQNGAVNIDIKDVSKNIYMYWPVKPYLLQGYLSVLGKLPFFCGMDTYLVQFLENLRVRFKFIIKILKSRINFIMTV